MSDPGVAHEKFTCIDSNSTVNTFRFGGIFYDGTFKDLLHRGYLDEGSIWIEKNTRKKYVIRGKQIPIWASDEQKQSQTLEEMR